MNKPVILTSKGDFYGINLVKEFQFVNGPKVPMYEVSTISGLNQLIGFAKFINRDYGEVYYRGVNKVFDNVLPSLMRNRKSGEAKDLKKRIKSLYTNGQFRCTLKLDLPDKTVSMPIASKKEYLRSIERNNKNIVEGVLQHYSGSTRFLDIVDNHWVALWMGLYEYEELGKGLTYSRYKKRVIPQVDYLERIATLFSEDKVAKLVSSSEISQALKVPKDEQDKYFMYILLIASPNDMIELIPGAYENHDFALVDLRKALPSFFVRPHAQHAYVIKTRDKASAKDYDLSSQVVGILRIRVDKADEWLGNGTLLTQSNLFPPPAVDLGYDTLLNYYNDNTDIFRIREYLSEVK